MWRRTVLTRVVPGVALGCALGWSRPNIAAAADAPILLTRQRGPGALTGAWLAPEVEPGFPFTRLVASWNAQTPGDSRLRIEVQLTTVRGDRTPWYTLGVWAADDPSRTSVSGQRDAFAEVQTDTLVARGQSFQAYRLRVSPERATSDTRPAVRLLAAEVSDAAFTAGQATSRPLRLAEPIELAVPARSQEVHAHHYPQWGGGGEAWCSPTSTRMVVDYWGRGPTDDDLAWVDPEDPDPRVDFAARGTYDAAYRGTGNWSFNVAYAGRYDLTATVTQLRSLAEAERLVRAGIPLVASIASRPGELDGFLYAGGTNGHLIVLTGFDELGQPIVNDPAAWSDEGVRRVYDRAQLERVWLRGSGGTVYLIAPDDVALPATPAGLTANW
jgi:hypothetical protein